MSFHRLRKPSIKVYIEICIARIGDIIPSRQSSFRSSLPPERQSRLTSAKVQLILKSGIWQQCRNIYYHAKRELCVKIKSAQVLDNCFGMEVECDFNCLILHAIQQVLVQADRQLMAVLCCQIRQHPLLPELHQRWPTVASVLAILQRSQPRQTLSSTLKMHRWLNSRLSLRHLGWNPVKGYVLGPPPLSQSNSNELVCGTAAGRTA